MWLCHVMRSVPGVPGTRNLSTPVSTCNPQRMFGSIVMLNRETSCTLKPVGQRHVYFLKESFLVFGHVLLQSRLAFTAKKTTSCRIEIVLKHAEAPPHHLRRMPSGTPCMKRPPCQLSTTASTVYTDSTPLTHVTHLDR